MLQDGWGQGEVSAGQEGVWVHSCLGSAQNSAPLLSCKVKFKFQMAVNL